MSGGPLPFARTGKVQDTYYNEKQDSCSRLDFVTLIVIFLFLRMDALYSNFSITTAEFLNFPVNMSACLSYCWFSYCIGRSVLQV